MVWQIEQQKRHRPTRHHRVIPTNHHAHRFIGTRTLMRNMIERGTHAQVILFSRTCRQRGSSPRLRRKRSSAVPLWPSSGVLSSPRCPFSVRPSRFDMVCVGKYEKLEFFAEEKRMEEVVGKVGNTPAFCSWSVACAVGTACWWRVCVVMMMPSPYLRCRRQYDDLRLPAGFYPRPSSLSPMDTSEEYCQDLTMIPNNAILCLLSSSYTF